MSNFKTWYLKMTPLHFMLRLILSDYCISKRICVTEC